MYILHCVQTPIVGEHEAIIVRPGIVGMAPARPIPQHNRCGAWVCLRLKVVRPQQIQYLLSLTSYHGDRGPMCVEGEFVWKLKDKIDRDWLGGYRDLVPMSMQPAADSTASVQSTGSEDHLIYSLSPEVHHVLGQQTMRSGFLNLFSFHFFEQLLFYAVQMRRVWVESWGPGAHSRAASPVDSAALVSSA